MKRLFILLWIVLIIVFSSDLYSQVPQYRLVAKNFDHPKFTGNYVSFDIYLIHTDTTRFEYAGGEFCFNFYTPVAHGGILSYQIVDFESQLPPSLRPRDPKVWINPGDTSQISISLNTIPEPGQGFNIPQDPGGVKIVRMFLYTSVQSMLVRIDTLAAHSIDLRLRWRAVTNEPTTKLYSYIGNTLTDITNPSSFSLDTFGLRIFPVELISFESSVRNNSVELSWTTANEINNSGFEVQRRISDSVNWIKAGFVNGKGTTNDPEDYFFNERLNSGKYSYRLKQIDYNGNYEYYDLMNEVEISTPLIYNLSQNYPNPFNPSTKINFQIIQNGNVVVNLYDNLGKFEKNLTTGFRTAGYYTLEINMENYPSGVYYYKVEAGSFNEVRKMLLIK